MAAAGRRAGRAGSPPDRGTAVVDFALVGALVTLVFVAVVQLAVVTAISLRTL